MKKIFFMIIVITETTIFCGCEKEKNDVNNFGALYGVVYDAKTGNLVNAARVELGVKELQYNPYGGHQDYVFTTLQTVVTGSDGQYEFHNIEQYNSEYGYEEDYYVRILTLNLQYQVLYYSVSIKNGITVNYDIPLFLY